MSLQSSGLHRSERSVPIAQHIHRKTFFLQSLGNKGRSFLIIFDNEEAHALIFQRTAIPARLKPHPARSAW